MKLVGRRDFLQWFGAGAALTAFGAPFGRLLAAPAPTLTPTKNGTPPGTEFFIFIHAAGGWDVTLWADPRNERKGLVEPASTDNMDPGPIRRWKNVPVDSDTSSFAILQPRGCNIPFGPGIGDLLVLHDRLLVVNGLAMNTVSHPDGSAFSATGRHLQGSRAPQSSINTIVAAELGTEQVLPSISVQFPSSFVGENLDRRAAPLAVERIGSIGRSLARAQQYESGPDRNEVTALLSDESRNLGKAAAYPQVFDGEALQLGNLGRMLAPGMQDLFNENRLKAARPELNYKSKFHGQSALAAAFAVEAMRRNVVRAVSFAAGGFDTHANNYRQQAEVQQSLFDLLAALVKTLDATPHPLLTSTKLSETTHILVVSDFCRTPQINIGGGRDHYPNNSALVISPRFRGNFVFGKSDHEQLLPLPTKKFIDGERAIAPPDLLATFVSAFGIDPRKYLRDGEVVPELLHA